MKYPNMHYNISNVRHKNVILIKYKIKSLKKNFKNQLFAFDPHPPHSLQDQKTLNIVYQNIKCIIKITNA